MGLTKTEDVTGSVSKTFSDDVLKIEICGPEQQHLSVIDVPGIFRKTTQGVTTKADIKLVRNMVSAYMKNPRSAMLAVIPANTDIGTQEILDMAEQWDPKGQRTLGVLTKPDLVYKGAEQDIVNIIEGRSHALHLGWCIVRNPGQQELKDLVNDRHATEKEFFATRDPWRKISKDCVGIQALQKRLVDVLAELIRREFPHVSNQLFRLIIKDLLFCRLGQVFLLRKTVPAKGVSYSLSSRTSISFSCCACQEAYSCQERTALSRDGFI